MNMKRKPSNLERERWEVFKQAMVIMGVNEEYFLKMYEQAFLNGDITIDQIHDEISFNKDEILKEKFKRIEYQEISIDERLRAWEKAKEKCRLRWADKRTMVSGIIISRHTDSPKYGLEMMSKEQLSLIEDFLSGKIATYNQLFTAWREAEPYFRPNQCISWPPSEVENPLSFMEYCDKCESMEVLLLEIGRQLGVSQSTIKIYSGDY